MKVIHAENAQLITFVIHAHPLVDTANNNVISDTENDILKLIVYNRYKKAKPQIAFIHGFGIQNAAIAASCAHDSHNIIALGTEDSLIVKAVNRIIEIKGGLIIVRKNNEEASVP